MSSRHIKFRSAFVYSGTGFRPSIHSYLPADVSKSAEVTHTAIPTLFDTHVNGSSLRFSYLSIENTIWISSATRTHNRFSFHPSMNEFSAFQHHLFPFHRKLEPVTSLGSYHHSATKRGPPHRTSILLTHAAIHTQRLPTVLSLSGLSDSSTEKKFLDTFVTFVSQYWLSVSDILQKIFYLDPFAVGSFIALRLLFLRGLALIYFVAFLIAFTQNKALIGDAGITPARHKWSAWGLFDNHQDIHASVNHTLWQRFQRSLSHIHFYFQRWRALVRSTSMSPVSVFGWFGLLFSKWDPLLDAVAITGLLLSALVLVSPAAANVPIMLVLWIAQQSLMSVGAVWYAFGWEALLAETGFLAIFTVPLITNPAKIIANATIATTNTYALSPLYVFAFRWLLFRLMLGAGLIKLRAGDSKWINLTVMHHHYETQPVPNFMSHLFHRLPSNWHKFEVLANHAVELIFPWLLILPFVPPAICTFAAYNQIAFQAAIILSGNFSFLNWLTIVIALLSFNDRVVQSFSYKCSSLLESTTSSNKATSSFLSTINDSSPILKLWSSHPLVLITFFLLIAILSVPNVRNLISRRQKMNASFDKLSLVNSYGAFGSVDEQRFELIFKGASHWTGPWLEYHFKVKPGDRYTTPPWITPFHYRLDWCLWIATHGPIHASPWLLKLLLMMFTNHTYLQNNTSASLLDKKRGNPFAASSPPKYIRIEKYHYTYAYGQPQSQGQDQPKDQCQEQDSISLSKQSKPFWNRHLVSSYYPKRGVTTLESVLRDLQTLGISISPQLAEQVERQIKLNRKEN